MKPDRAIQPKPTDEFLWLMIESASAGKWDDESDKAECLQVLWTKYAEQAGGRDAKK